MVVLGLGQIIARCMSPLSAQVLGGVNNGEEDSAAARKAASNMTLGNICLLVNTLAMACYYIQAKRLVAKYAPVQVAAWAYLVAATMMGSAALAFTTRADWNFPNALIMPLLYWITVCSIFGYYVVTWAMRHLPASQVAAFQCLQPFLGSLLAFAVLHEKLSWWDLGAVGVVAGLFLVSMDTKREAQVRSAVSRLRMMMTSRSSSSIILPRDSSPLIKVQAIA